MATPIKDTPVLTGKDARRFEAWLKENEGKKISQEELERMRAIYRRVRIVDKQDDMIHTNA